MKKKNINIVVDLDDVLQCVYAESARRGLAAPEVYVLTEDNESLLVQYVKSGLDDVRTHMAGYVRLCSFNPNVNEHNIVIQLTLENPASAAVDDAMSATLVRLLANYALLRFYGERDTYYGVAWRKLRAQLLLVLARDQAAIAQ